MPLRTYLPALLLTLAAAPAAAHTIPPGVYAEVPYNNNPFLFCELGMPEHGWIATNWRVGAWKPISKYVNWQWIPTYVVICPAAARPAGGGAPYRPSDAATDSR